MYWFILCLKNHLFGILEAYNYNTIVIGSNRGSLKEIIKHEYNGFLYDAPASFINLKEAMLALS